MDKNKKIEVKKLFSSIVAIMLIATSFLITSTIPIKAGGDPGEYTITIVFPADTEVANTSDGGTITGTVNGTAIETVVGFPDNRTVIITIPLTIDNDGEVVVVLTEGITNPTTFASNYQLTVATSVENNPVASQNYEIKASLDWSDTVFVESAGNDGSIATVVNEDDKYRE